MMQQHTGETPVPLPFENQTSGIQFLKSPRTHLTKRACGWALKMLCSGMALSYPTLIPGLRSPYDQVNGLVYFGRMLDKIRLAAAGKLPEGWQPMRGTTVKGTLDGRCCTFLHIDYAALEVETLKGVSDEEL